MESAAATGSQRAGARLLREHDAGASEEDSPEEGRRAVVEPNSGRLVVLRDAGWWTVSARTTRVGRRTRPTHSMTEKRPRTTYTGQHAQGNMHGTKMLLTAELPCVYIFGSTAKMLDCPAESPSCKGAT